MCNLRDPCLSLQSTSEPNADVKTHICRAMAQEVDSSAKICRLVRIDGLCCGALQQSSGKLWYSMSDCVGDIIRFIAGTVSLCGSPRLVAQKKLLLRRVKAKVMGKIQPPLTLQFYLTLFCKMETGEKNTSKALNICASGILQLEMIRIRTYAFFSVYVYKPYRIHVFIV